MLSSGAKSKLPCCLASCVSVKRPPSAAPSKSRYFPGVGGGMLAGKRQSLEITDIVALSLAAKRWMRKSQETRLQASVEQRESSESEAAEMVGEVSSGAGSGADGPGEILLRCQVHHSDTGQRIQRQETIYSASTLFSEV